MRAGDNERVAGQDRRDVVQRQETLVAAEGGFTDVARAEWAARVRDGGIAGQSRSPLRLEADAKLLF
jgi:hypothetical protein